MAPPGNLAAAGRREFRKAGICFAPKHSLRRAGAKVVYDTSLFPAPPPGNLAAAGRMKSPKGQHKLRPSSAQYELDRASFLPGPAPA